MNEYPKIFSCKNFSRFDGDSGKGYINALDLNTLDFVWRDLQIGMYKCWGGAMSTATGLLAYGDDDNGRMHR
jgi:glucose dehydrogenase